MCASLIMCSVPRPWVVKPAACPLHTQLNMLIFYRLSAWQKCDIYAVYGDSLVIFTPNDTIGAGETGVQLESGCCIEPAA